MRLNPLKNQVSFYLRGRVVLYRKQGISAS